MKQMPLEQQSLNNVAANFQNILKTMTPMPKLNHAFSLPQPSTQGNAAAGQAQPTKQSKKQNQVSTEYQSRERVQRLK